MSSNSTPIKGEKGSSGTPNKPSPIDQKDNQPLTGSPARNSPTTNKIESPGTRLNKYNVVDEYSQHEQEPRASGSDSTKNSTAGNTTTASTGGEAGDEKKATMSPEGSSEQDPAKKVGDKAT